MRDGAHRRARGAGAGLRARRRRDDDRFDRAAGCATATADASQTCFDCGFSKDTDANWGPIVGTAANDGETGFINFGACFACFGYVESEACGQALQFEQFCYNIACNECTTTSTERQKCVETAGSTGMCADFGDRTFKACPNMQTSAKKCNSIIDAIKTLCGPA